MKALGKITEGARFLFIIARIQKKILLALLKITVRVNTNFYY